MSIELTADDLKTLERIEAPEALAKAQALQHAKPGEQPQPVKLKRSVRDQMAARRRRIEACAKARAELHALTASIHQTAELAEQRGEDVERTPGRVVIQSRDGLASLLKSQALTADQVRAAQAYRMCAEIAAAGLKSQLAERSGSPRQVRDLERSRAELHRAYLMARLAQFERAVARIGGRDRRELTVLQLVAGEGHTINSLGASGGARDVNTKALRRALDAILAVMPVRPQLQNPALVMPLANHRQSEPQTP